MFGARNKTIGSPTDCSNYLCRVFQWAGEPVLCTNAARMYAGLDNWDHEKEPRYYKSKACDIASMTIDPKRPHGHTGYFTEDVDDELKTIMAHAGGKGVVAVPYLADGWYYNRTDLIFTLKARAK